MQLADMPFTVSGKSQASLDIVKFEFWEILDNLFRLDALCQLIQHIINGDSQPSYARFATPLAWFNSNVIKSFRFFFL